MGRGLEDWGSQTPPSDFVSEEGPRESILPPHMDLNRAVHQTFCIFPTSFRTVLFCLLLVGCVLTL